MASEPPTPSPSTSTPKEQPASSPWQSQISDIIRGGYFSLYLPKASAAGKPSISFAIPDSTITPRSSSKHSRPRAKSPKPLSHTEPAVTRSQRKRENPISAVGVERPAKRKRTVAFESGQPRRYPSRVPECQLCRAHHG